MSSTSITSSTASVSSTTTTALSTPTKEEILGEKILNAICNGNIPAAQKILRGLGRDCRDVVSYQNPQNGVTPLMKAAERGEAEVVSLLLQNGAPWNAIDSVGQTAGNYALAKGHQQIVDQLLAAGVSCELLFAALKKKDRSTPNVINASYLDRGVKFTDDQQKLLDDNNDAVMMEWERPIMEAHANILCETKGDVLNIGFGMGIVDTFIQSHKPRSHTIIEAHPTVYKSMIAKGWDKKENVHIYFGRWQDVLPTLVNSGKWFDGIFFDTYGEDWTEQRKLHSQLPTILRSGGLYSFFNGFCPDNIFLQGVACEVIKQELLHVGIVSDFVQCQLSSRVDKDKSWEGVRRKYFHDDTYYLPICRRSKANNLNSTKKSEKRTNSSKENHTDHRSHSASPCVSTMTIATTQNKYHEAKRAKVTN